MGNKLVNNLKFCASCILIVALKIKSRDAEVSVFLFDADYVLIYPYGKCPYGATHILSPARARDQIDNTEFDMSKNV